MWAVFSLELADQPLEVLDRLGALQRVASTEYEHCYAADAVLPGQTQVARDLVFTEAARQCGHELGAVDSDLRVLEPTHHLSQLTDVHPMLEVTAEQGLDRRRSLPLASCETNHPLSKLGIGGALLLVKVECNADLATHLRDAFEGCARAFGTAELALEKAGRGYAFGW